MEKLSIGYWSYPNGTCSFGIKGEGGIPATPEEIELCKADIEDKAPLDDEEVTKLIESLEEKVTSNSARIRRISLALQGHEDKHDPGFPYDAPLYEDLTREDVAEMIAPTLKMSRISLGLAIASLILIILSMFS